MEKHTDQLNRLRCQTCNYQYYRTRELQKHLARNINCKPIKPEMINKEEFSYIFRILNFRVHSIGDWSEREMYDILCESKIKEHKYGTKKFLQKNFEK